MTDQAATLSDFKSTRTSRRAALKAEYRELVRTLAQEDSMQSEQAGRLDDIMDRLKVSDEGLATDIEDTKQHSRLTQSISDFREEQPQIDKQFAEWGKAIHKAKDDLKAAELRLIEAHRERHLAGEPYNKNRADMKCLQELESRNHRVFGLIDHD